MSDYWLAAAIAMAVVAVYVTVWMKIKHIDMWEKTPIGEMAQSIRDTSEYLPVWDEAVESWISDQTGRPLGGAESRRAYRA